MGEREKTAEQRERERDEVAAKLEPGRELERQAPAAPRAARPVVFTERLVVYVEAGTRAQLDRLAAAEHLNVGTYLRRLVMAHTSRKAKGKGRS